MKKIEDYTVGELVELGFYVSANRCGATERGSAMEQVQAMLPNSSVIAGATGCRDYQFSGARASNGKVSIAIW